MNDEAPRRRHVLAAGALAGLVAALLMTLVQLVLRLVAGVPTPAELVGDRVAPLIPVGPFLDLLELVGGFDQAKALSVLGVIGATLASGAGLGAVYATVADRRRRPPGDPPGGAAGDHNRALAVLIVSVGLAWVGSVAVVFWPLLGTEVNGRPPPTARAVNAAALFVSYGAFAGGVVATHRFLTRRPGGPVPAAAAHGTADGPGLAEPSGSVLGRRALLAGGAGLGLALASGGVMARLNGRSTFGYDGLQVNGELQPITPNDKFYVVTQNIIDPSVDRAVWRLKVDGAVERPRSYDLAAVGALPAVVQESTLVCISNGVGAGLMSNAVWKGVPLRSLLEAAGPERGVRDVVLHGVDGYTDTFAFEKAMDPTTLVAYEMNGRPLPRRHGFPARIIVPGLYGEKNVKWVNRIELSTSDEEGYYERQGWGPDFVVKTQSRFTTPAFDRPLPMAPVLLRGSAFAGDRDVSRVEVSTDDGATWQQATMTYAGSRLTWSLWSHAWTPARPGEHRLAVRAYDGTGAPQVEKPRPSAPEGATGYHRVTATVA